MTPRPVPLPIREATAAYATTAGLTDADIAHHEALAITADMLERAKVHRVDDQDARDCLAVKGRTGDLSGLIYPYLDPTNGYVVTRRLRRDHPELENGKLKDKYLSAWGDRRHLYFAPGSASALRDVSVDVVISEAEKSVLAITCAAQHRGRRILALGTGGCWGWRGVKGKAIDASGATVDEKGALSDFDRIAWTGRKAIICFDANASTNQNVQLARNALVAELTKRGAVVRLVNLPTMPGVNGPDDFIGRFGDEPFFALIDRGTSSAHVLIVRKASDVPDEPLVKVFGGRLVCGSFGLIAGPGEGGKGMTLADLTARFTTGDPFPGESHTRPPANVLICVTEDSQGRVKSRLRTVGADLERVYFVEGPEVTRGGLTMPSPMMLDDDAGALYGYAKEIEAQAFFLETVVEHFGDRSGTRRRSTNNEADVRAALAPFRAICASAHLFGLGRCIRVNRTRVASTTRSPDQPRFAMSHAVRITSIATRRTKRRIRCGSSFRQKPTICRNVRRRCGFASFRGIWIAVRRARAQFKTAVMKVACCGRRTTGWSTIAMRRRSGCRLLSAARCDGISAWKMPKNS